MCIGLNSLQIRARIRQSPATYNKNTSKCVSGPQTSHHSTLWCNSRLGCPWTQCGKFLYRAFAYIFYDSRPVI